MTKSQYKPKDAKEPMKRGPFLTPKEYAYVTGVSISKLEKDRKNRIGPTHLKIGGRVLYLDPSEFGPIAA